MKRLCLLSACFLLDVAGAMAKTGGDGSILGVVSDANGGSVAGATVTVRNLDTGLVKTEITHADGGFEISPLPEGNYSVSVTFTGFKTWTLAQTDLTIRERKRVSPMLQL